MNLPLSFLFSLRISPSWLKLPRPKTVFSIPLKFLCIQFLFSLFLFFAFKMAIFCQRINSRNSRGFFDHFFLIFELIVNSYLLMFDYKLGRNGKCIFFFYSFLILIFPIEANHVN